MIEEAIAYITVTNKIVKAILFWDIYESAWKVETIKSNGDTTTNVYKECGNRFETNIDFFHRDELCAYLNNNHCGITKLSYDNIVYNSRKGIATWTAPEN